jgi:hypothetical protein
MGWMSPLVRMLSELCSASGYVADAASRRMADGGARSEGHITITANRAISATARLHATPSLDEASSKLCQGGGRLRQQPSFLSW